MDARLFVAEDLWRAQRDGVRAELIDLASGAAMPFASSLDAALALVAQDAEALGCVSEVGTARAIVAGGTSADRQLAVFTEARGRELANGTPLAPSSIGLPGQRPEAGDEATTPWTKTVEA